MSAEQVAARLEALASAEDIPANRRRELLRLAAELQGAQCFALPAGARAEPVADNYFRRQHKRYLETRLIGGPK